MTKPPRPLEGIRIVSLEQYISGPYCTSILASLGAEVLKIENPRTGGDPRRAYTPKRDGQSSGFAGYNRGKRSVALDFDEPAGRERLVALLADAQVLVSNLRPGALEPRGLGARVLREEYPHLIVCEITGFGVTGGPYGDWPAFDSVIQAMSGLTSVMTPAADGRPSLAPMPTTDIQSGTWAALGILSAIVGQQATGRGVHIDAAMYDIAVAALERPLTLLEFGMPANRDGEDAQSAVGVFRAVGGSVALVIPTDAMWRRCCAAIGRPDLLTDGRLVSIEGRARHMSDVIIPALEDWAIAGRLDAHECAARLRSAGQPAGPIQSIEEVRRCPQLAHRALFEPIADAPGTPPPAIPRFPLLFDGAVVPSGAVPAFGEYGAHLPPP